MLKKSFTISGKIIDVVARKIFSGILTINNGRIISIKETMDIEDQFILPGLIDAHIHVESSMLIPSEFAKIAVKHGTIGSVSDPHEIANVLGIDGVKFMIEDGEKVPFKFYFGAPSCVPATTFESSGAVLGPREIEELLENQDIKYLAEMMNYPGVLFNDKNVNDKLEIAKKYNKPIDGHAPGLQGEDAEKYCKAGISTDHECFTIEEAIDKINAGMTIQIREGSAAKNFETLIPLIENYPDKIMLCSDDKHPDDLVDGHINLLVKRAIKLGYNIFDVLRSCTLIPKNHYKLENGLLQKGDAADFIIVDNLDHFNIKQTYIDGQLVVDNSITLFHQKNTSVPNNFVAEKINSKDLEVKPFGTKLRVIKAIEGQLITKVEARDVKSSIDSFEGDLEKDILKIVVLNRYKKAKPAIGFITGFGLKEGAIASTVAHDSHNIIALGTNDEDITNAINSLVVTKGGIVALTKKEQTQLPLPVAGLMTNESAELVAEKYKSINSKVLSMGSKFKAPFMTLSFMALLVIPELKLSDKGLFDGNSFSLTSLFMD